MKTIITLLLLSFAGKANSQILNFAWARQAGGTGAVSYLDMAVDGQGSVYVTGYFTGTIDFDPGVGVFNLSSIGGQDIYVYKLDLNGNFVWVRQMGSSDRDVGTSIELDANNNIYITGYFSGTTDFDPGVGIYTLSPINFTDFFICRLDDQGNLNWANQFGKWAVESKARLALDGAGNIHLSGNFSGTADFDPGPGSFNMVSSSISDIFVSKLDPSGNFIWAKQINVSYTNYIFDMVLDASGNVFVTGDFSGIADFDPGPAAFTLVSTGDYDSYIFKLDNNGNFSWAIHFGSGGTDRSTSMAVDRSGNVITTGYFAGTVDFDPSSLVHSLSSNGVYPNNTYLLKLDNDGHYLWAKKIGGRDVAADQHGNIFLTAILSGTMDIDPGPSTYYLTSVGLEDIYICKLNASGNFVWAKNMGGPTASGNPSGILTDNDGNIYTSGGFTLTIDFDPGTTVHNMTAIGVYDMFVHKISLCKNPSSHNITASVCSSYTLNGETYTETGIYTQTLVNAAGCDSILTLNLTINNRYSQFGASACGSYTWNGQTYTNSGTYKDTLIASNGCDSLIIMNLVIKENIFTSVNASICRGQNYEGYNVAGVYTDSFISTDGCDSIRTLTLEVKEATASIIDTTICDGQRFGGYQLPGTYVDVLTGVNGCDSVRTINLTVKYNCGMYIPNVFTPNNDGLNDLFKPTINSIVFKGFSLVIFNRYGEKIFETYEYGKGWDGKFKGKDQLSGTYVYRITYTLMNGYESEYKGTVLLIR